MDYRFCGTQCLWSCSSANERVWHHRFMRRMVRRCHRRHLSLLEELRSARSESLNSKPKERLRQKCVFGVFLRKAGNNGTIIWCHSPSFWHHGADFKWTLPDRDRKFWRRSSPLTFLETLLTLARSRSLLSNATMGDGGKCLKTLRQVPTDTHIYCPSLRWIHITMRIQALWCDTWSFSHTFFRFHSCHFPFKMIS